MQDIFTWSNDFYTHIDVVDQQHMNLVEIINRLSRLSFNPDHHLVDDFEDIKRELVNYVHTHFGTEEKLMETHQIYEAHVMMHKDNHRLFTKEIKEYFSDEDVIKEDKIGEITEYLIKWLAYHILNVDKSFARQIEKIEGGMSPEEAYNSDIQFIDNNSEPLLKALHALFFMVAEKNRELKEINEQLEHKIRQRTFELEESNKRLGLLALKDELTDLANRRYAELSINQLLSTARRYGHIFSVLLVDADKFKRVNDTCGHDKGDLVIKWIGNYLKESVRQSDIVCRIGGDEFLVICPHTEIDSGLKLAEKIVDVAMEGIETPYGDCWSPSLSVGVAEATEKIAEIGHLLKRADMAMYEAKKGGGGQASKG